MAAYNILSAQLEDTFSTPNSTTTTTRTRRRRRSGNWYNFHQLDNIWLACQMHFPLEKSQIRKEKSQKEITQKSKEKKLQMQLSLKRGKRAKKGKEERIT